jgi:hypothetical protein
MSQSINTNPVNFTRTINDVNGNPRYIVHFLTFAADYNEALTLARKIGARVYRGKSYGGGFVVQSYSLDATVRDINEATGREYTGYVCK